jgi:hypothetical protein
VGASTNDQFQFGGPCGTLPDAIQSDGTAPAKMRLPLIGKVPKQYDFLNNKSFSGRNVCDSVAISL